MAYPCFSECFFATHLEEKTQRRFHKLSVFFGAKTYSNLQMQLRNTAFQCQKFGIPECSGNKLIIDEHSFYYLIFFSVIRKQALKNNL